MILIVNENNVVFAYNKKRTKESMDASKGEVWYEGDFFFDMGENIEGKGKRYKWNGTEVEIEYFDIPTPSVPELTDSEIAQAEMMLMQAEILEKLNAMEV